MYESHGENFQVKPLCSSSFSESIIWIQLVITIDSIQSVRYVIECKNWVNRNTL